MARLKKMSEKMKRHLGLLGMAMMVASIVAILSISGSYSKSVDPYNARSFSVQGEGKVISVPDVAQFSFSVITQGGINTAEIQKENTEKMNELIKELKGMDIEAKDITTANYSIYPQYDWRDGEQILRGYVVSQNVIVKIRNLDLVGNVIEAAGSLGSNQIGGLSFTIDEPEALRQLRKS